MKIINKIKTCIFAVVSLFIFTACILLPKESSYAEGGVTLKLHYERSDGDYAPWSVWFWEEGKDGADYPFHEEDGSMVATMEVTPGVMSVGFIVRTESWEKDVAEDQFIDISELVSGTANAYVVSGKPGYEMIYGDDVVKGIKLKSAKYNGDASINVKMTGEISEDLSDLFLIEGKDLTVTIKAVTYLKDNIYKIDLAAPLDEFKTYKITYEGTKYPIIMNTQTVYSSEEFESQFTYNGKDLGAAWTKEETTFRVWAPTAEKLEVNLYEGGDARMKDLKDTIPMTKDINGTWVARVSGDLNGVYYTYKVTIDGTSKEACDPYAKTTGVNGARAMVIDMESTNPENWENDVNPHSGEKITDAIIYEGHIRDLTASDTGITNKGKYLGVVEEGTTSENGIPTGLDHMKDLGITHLHILPMYDFGSVDELKTVTDIYNWGYDPVNFNVPEGSYSTNAQDGAVRVKEVKEMVAGLHNAGISVVMDVVYNHVYNAGDFCFNKLVPGYFSRITESGTYSNGSGCGNDTASERAMVRKYIVDSVNYWANEYHIDGFRFDLVGLLDVDTINEIVSTVHENHPDVIFYGEGWSLTTILTKENVELATQANSTLTPEFAYFNDTIRDGLKGSVFDKGKGFVSGSDGDAEKIRRCFVGLDRWCKTPAQTINYASCHDNNTLIDRLTLSRPDASREDLIKMNNLAAAIYLTSEGVPFMQAGEELLRTKVNADGSFNENSYNAGDKVNEINYANLSDTEYSNVYNYYKGLIELRKAHKTLRLDDASLVEKLISKYNVDAPNALAFHVDGSLEEESFEEMILVFNAEEEAITVSLPEGEWDVVVDETLAGNEAIETVSGEVSVSAISAKVFVKGMTIETDIIDAPKSKTNKGIIAGSLAALAVALAGAFAIIKRKRK